MIKRKSRVPVFLVFLCTIALFSGCVKSYSTSIPVGKYYDTEGISCIHVINSSQMVLIDFDINQLLDIYDIEDTAVTGSDIVTALQNTITYTVEAEGNRYYMYAEVTRYSGLRIAFNPNTNQFEFMGELYSKGD